MGETHKRERGKKSERKKRGLGKRKGWRGGREMKDSRDFIYVISKKRNGKSE